MIPFYVGGTIVNPRNHLSQSGADKLAREIERKWLRHGFRVHVWTEVGNPLSQDPYYVIRSDMINGLPCRSI